MTGLFNENGKLPEEYFTQTLKTTSPEEWAKLPPEIQFAQLFADYGFLSPDSSHYEFDLEEGADAELIDLLQAACKNLDIELVPNPQGDGFITNRVDPRIDDILEYFS
jgi:hypothetical protein